MTVLCLGETMAAVRVQGPLRLGGEARVSIAGCEGNVAIGLSRLGVRSAWVGVVGDDELGALVRRTLLAEGVDCAAVRVHASRPTGLLMFEPVFGARTRALYYRSGSAGAQLAARDVERAVAALPDRLTAVVTSGITLALGPEPAEAVPAALCQARLTGATSCLSINYRSALWTREQAAASISPVAGLADVLIGDAGEVALAAGQSDPDHDPADCAMGLLDAGVQEVVVTRGAAGACAFDGSGRVDQPAVETRVVDTIGAGDAFTSGYLAARLAGMTLAQRLRAGAVSAAFCVASHGDWEGLPTRRDLDLLSLESGGALR